jgi:hypothetical protein
LGTIDDEKENWLKDYFHDSSDLNDLGHEEITYALVPIFFGAFEHGKGKPRYNRKHSYFSLKKTKKAADSIQFQVKNKIHS